MRNKIPTMRKKIPTMRDKIPTMNQNTGHGKNILTIKENDDNERKCRP